MVRIRELPDPIHSADPRAEHFSGTHITTPTHSQDYSTGTILALRNNSTATAREGPAWVTKMKSPVKMKMVVNTSLTVISVPRGVFVAWKFSGLKCGAGSEREKEE
jgi:hypothetical protein